MSLFRSPSPLSLLVSSSARLFAFSPLRRVYWCTANCHNGQVGLRRRLWAGLCGQLRVERNHSTDLPLKRTLTKFCSHKISRGPKSARRRRSRRQIDHRNCMAHRSKWAAYVPHGHAHPMYQVPIRYCVAAERSRRDLKCF